MDSSTFPIHRGLWAGDSPTQTLTPSGGGEQGAYLRGGRCCRHFAFFLTEAKTSPALLPAGSSLGSQQSSYSALLQAAEAFALDSLQSLPPLVPL